MAAQTPPPYEFVVSSLPAGTFTVLSFQGREEISHPYRYEIELVSEDDAIDYDQVMDGSARLVIHQNRLFLDNEAWQREHASDEPNEIHGVVAEFEQMQKSFGVTHYRAVLVPRVWWMSVDNQNMVFLDKSIPEIIQEKLDLAARDVGIDYEMKLESYKGDLGDRQPDDKNFPRWEYVCQYNESALDFIHRLMEREGFYYFFEQTTTGEKLVITNKHIHSSPVKPDTLLYAPGENLATGPNIHEYTIRQLRIPKKISLRDYNYAKPDLEVKGEAEVLQQGYGDVYYYGENFLTPGEGDALAAVRAEEIGCWKLNFHGRSDAPFLRAGYTVSMDRHYRDDFNQSYLIIAIEHHGQQPAYLLSGMGATLSERDEKLQYSNHFTTIPADVQFRPRRRTPKPHIAGTVHGRIDLNQLDDKGRYKVRMPFDRADSGEGKASCWIRLSKPYTGSDFGMHFPLFKDTEVIVGFTGGDPDRPVILGAMENPNTPSVTNDSNVGRLTLATGSVHEFSISGVSDHEGQYTGFTTNAPMHGVTPMSTPAFPLGGDTETASTFSAPVDASASGTPAETPAPGARETVTVETVEVVLAEEVVAEAEADAVEPLHAEPAARGSISGPEGLLSASWLEPAAAFAGFAEEGDDASGDEPVPALDTEATYFQSIDGWDATLTPKEVDTRNVQHAQIFKEDHVIVHQKAVHTLTGGKTTTRNLDDVHYQVEADTTENYKGDFTLAQDTGTAVSKSWNTSDDGTHTETIHTGTLARSDTAKTSITDSLTAATGTSLVQTLASGSITKAHTATKTSESYTENLDRTVNKDYNERVKGDFVSVADKKRSLHTKGDCYEIVDGHVYKKAEHESKLTTSNDGEFHIGSKWDGTLGTKGDVTIGSSMEALIGVGLGFKVMEVGATMLEFGYTYFRRHHASVDFSSHAMSLNNAILEKGGTNLKLDPMAAVSTAAGTAQVMAYQTAIGVTMTVAFFSFVASILPMVCVIGGNSEEKDKEKKYDEEKEKTK